MGRVVDVAGSGVEKRAESIASGFGQSVRLQHRTATSSATSVAPISLTGSTRSPLGSVTRTAMATRHVLPGVSGGSLVRYGIAASAVTARGFAGFAVSGLLPTGSGSGLPLRVAGAWATNHTRGYAKEAVKTMKVRRGGIDWLGRNDRTTVRPFRF